MSVPTPEPVTHADALAAAAAGWSVALLALALVLWQRRRFDRAARLVAEAAHELRGPLCAARLAIGSLERSFGEVPAIGARLAAVDAELRRAGLAVDDLGSALDAERAPADHATVDVGALVVEHQPAWSALADAHGVVLAVLPSGEPAPVVANESRLAQAIGNLVANGCEHGGGVVTVRVRRAAETVCVEVCDQGHGLSGPLDELGDRPSARRSGQRSRHAVRGHGLTVVRRVADELDGRLATAPSRRGARLVLELPLASHAKGRPTPVTAPGTFSGRRAS